MANFTGHTAGSWRVAVFVRDYARDLDLHVPSSPFTIQAREPPPLVALAPLLPLPFLPPSHHNLDSAHLRHASCPRKRQLHA